MKAARLMMLLALAVGSVALGGAKPPAAKGAAEMAAASADAPEPKRRCACAPAASVAPHSMPHW